VVAADAEEAVEGREGAEGEQLPEVDQCQRQARPMPVSPEQLKPSGRACPADP
jgi:hypothetical protein